MSTTFYLCICLQVVFIVPTLGVSVNVALNQPANQSDGNSVAAERAVDGNTDPGDDNTCTFIDTGDDEKSAWWYVDLGSVFEIQSVTVYNTNDEQKSQYLGEMNIYRSETTPTFSSPGCGGTGDITPSGESSTLSCTVLARYIMIQKRSSSSSRRNLTLCEVFVMATMSCPEHCQCENNQCGLCKQWYVPNGTCDVELKSATLDSSVDPVLEEITQTTAVMSFKQDEDDVPAGYESHYYYQLLYKTDLMNTFSVWENSDQVDHVSGQFLVTLTARELSPATSYTFKCSLYRTHRGVSQKGTTDSKEITVTTTATTTTSTITTTTITKPTTSTSSTSATTTTPTTTMSTTTTPTTTMSTTTTPTTTTSITTMSTTTKSTTTKPTTSLTSVFTESSPSSPITSDDPGSSTTSQGGEKPPGGDGSTGPAVQPKSDPLPMILGIVFGVLAVIILVIIVVVLLHRRKMKGPHSDERKGRLVIDTPHRVESGQSNNNEGFDNKALDAFDEADNKGQSAGSLSKPTVMVTPFQKPSQRVEQYANLQALQYSETKVPLSRLEHYIQTKHAEANGFKKEYARLPAGLKHKADTASKSTTKDKNRYLNVQAYDHSRVILDLIEGEEDSDYINANYIGGYKDKEKFYVATQGPKKETLGDFWRMLWLLNTDKVIMITKITENGKRKCEPYWPESEGAVKKFSYVTVTTLSVDCFADYTVRILSVEKDGETRTIRQLHFLSWTDKSIPEHKFPLLEFRKKVRSMYNPEKGPMVIHCSAGIGRTGTFIAMDYLLDQAAAEKQVDVYQFVQQMRKERMNMVQTLQQYIFIYDILLDDYKAGNKAFSTENFPTGYYNLKNNPQKLEEQFKDLNALTESPTDPTQECTGLSEENVDKNRDTNIVPADKHRPFLMRCEGFHNDYINAVFVPGFKQKNGSIATQMPLQDTVGDFWRLVWDHGSKIIVMLNHLDTEETSEEVNGCIYWPDDEDPVQQYGPIRVELKSEEPHNGYIIRTLNVSNTLREKEDPFNVRQFMLEEWPRDCALPVKPSTFTDLLESVQDCQKSSGNGPVLVHCMNGASRSGLFCAAMYMIEKLKEDQEINIFTTIRFVRLKRPQFIESLDQYIFLHELAQEFLSRNDLYANFKM